MRVAVIGAGVMGHGIAEVFSIYGNQVFLYDKFEDALKKGLEKIRWSLDKLYEKGKITEKPEDIMGRIIPIKDLKELKGSEVVIEAVPEDFNLKIEVFKEVEKHVGENTIIATNTSSLPISELSQALSKRERFLGLHFFNPPVLMGLVEVIRGEYTSDEVFAKGIEIVRSINKEPIPVRKDVIGFVVNRILFRIFTTACRLTNKYSVEQIDSTAKYVLKFPMGVFELLDFTGIDTNYLISKEVMKRGFDFTCPQLEELYKKGYYGSKSGKGFYDWSKGRPEIKFLPGPTPQELLAEAVREGRWLVENGVSTEEEVNKATRLGLGWPKGLFEYAKEYGL